MKNFCGEAKGGQGLSDQWFTPRWIFEKCGKFDLDPCGDSRWPIASETFTENGLERDWYGRVWMNPPYGRDVGLWTDKLAEHGNGLALIFARTDTKWFQSFARECSWIMFLAGRVKFINGESLSPVGTPGAPSILMAVGQQEIPNLNGVIAKF